MSEMLSMLTKYEIMEYNKVVVQMKTIFKKIFKYNVIFYSFRYIM